MALKYIMLKKWADYLKVYVDCLEKYSVLSIGYACCEIYLPSIEE